MKKVGQYCIAAIGFRFGCIAFAFGQLMLLGETAAKTHSHFTFAYGSGIRIATCMSNLEED